jgi:hypothetical protein
MLFRKFFGIGGTGFQPGRNRVAGETPALAILGVMNSLVSVLKKVDIYY